MDFRQITISKRKVKYPRLELRTGSPVLILPQEGDFDSNVIIGKHQKWLEQKMKFIENLKNRYKNQKIYQRSESSLVKIVTRFVNKLSKVLKVKPERVDFRYMKTKWGSCSKKKRICLNLSLRYLPTRLIRYVVLHEMTHLLIPNHSESFWLYVKKEFKNPEQCEEMLYGYWFLLNQRITSGNGSILINRAKN